MDDDIPEVGEEWFKKAKLKMPELEVDPQLYDDYCTNGRPTGFYVRAKLGTNYDTFDIACLTPKSLLQWLKSRGGDNPWAENVVGHLLGHGPLHK